MHNQEQNQVRELIPTLLSTDHISINTKRINFIYGQGVIVYNDTYAVEIYVPKNPNENHTFFAVDRHFGNIKNIGEYYRRLPVLNLNNPDVTASMRAQFEEALFANVSGESNVKEMYNRVSTKKVA